MSYPKLTEQEARFLRLIEDEKTPTEIAAIFSLSMSRVRVVVRNLCDKFDVDWIGELADAAHEARFEAAFPCPGCNGMRSALCGDCEAAARELADDDDGRTHIDAPVRAE